MNSVLENATAPVQTPYHGTHLQARQVGLTFAKRMMPPEAVEGVATVMLRVCAPAESGNMQGTYVGNDSTPGKCCSPTLGYHRLGLRGYIRRWATRVPMLGRVVARI
jgi:hypothetical protein